MKVLLARQKVSYDGSRASKSVMHGSGDGQVWNNVWNILELFAIVCILLNVKRDHCRLCHIYVDR